MCVRARLFVPAVARASFTHTDLVIEITIRTIALSLTHIDIKIQISVCESLSEWGKGHHLVTQVASGSPLHSDPPNACRAPPHDSTPTASFDVCLLDLLWPQPPLTSSLHQGSTLGPLISVVAACVKDARPSRWLAPLERPRWPPPPSGWTRHQPRCFRHERVGWRGSAGDVWLLLGARTWRTSGCPHLLSAAVRTCCHHLPNSAFPENFDPELARTTPGTGLALQRRRLR